MFLGILSEVAGRYSLYMNTSKCKFPHIKTDGDGLMLPANDAYNKDLYDSGTSSPSFLHKVEGSKDHITWDYGTCFFVTMIDGETTPILIDPEVHGSIYVFGSQKLIDFAAGYFAGYSGADVASVYRQIAEHYDPKLDSYIRISPEF